MAKQKSIFRDIIQKQIYSSLKRKFAHPGTTLFRGREIAALLDYVKANPLPMKTKVLDLGCGEGYIGQIVFNKIDMGIDILPEELVRAKKTKLYKKLKVDDARKLSLKNGSYDLVFSNSVIEHIESIDDVISEVSRVLDRRGYFIFTAPTNYFTTNLFFYDLFMHIKAPILARLYSRKRNELLNHHNLHSHVVWSKMLAKHHLKVKYHRYYLDTADTHTWDIACILLRLAEPLKPVHALINTFFSKKVDGILKKPTKQIKRGSSLLVVAQKT